jgi:hypothetical protein
MKGHLLAEQFISIGCEMDPVFIQIRIKLISPECVHDEEELIFVIRPTKKVLPSEYLCNQ